MFIQFLAVLTKKTSSDNSDSCSGDHKKMTAAGPASCSDDFVDEIKNGQVGRTFTLNEFGTYISKSFLKSVAYASYPAALYYVFTSKSNLSKRIFIGLGSLLIMRDLWQYANNQIKMETGGSVIDLITKDDD